MDDITLVESSFSATINAPIEKVDIPAGRKRITTATSIMITKGLIGCTCAQNLSFITCLRNGSLHRMLPICSERTILPGT